MAGTRRTRPMDISERALTQALESIRKSPTGGGHLFSNEWVSALIETVRSLRMQLARLEATLESEPFIDIVFDRMPDRDGANFIEVEDSRGASISVGQWLIRERDGRVVLRLPSRA